MVLSYEDVFAHFLGNISDCQFATLDVSEAHELMTEWLHKVLAKTYIRRIFSSVKFDDAVEQLTYTMALVTDDESDKEFVIELISKGMVVEWLNPQVMARTNVAQMFAGKEQKFFSQSSHLKEIKDLHDNSRIEIRKMIRDRGYIYNDYLEDSQ